MFNCQLYGVESRTAVSRAIGSGFQSQARHEYSILPVVSLTASVADVLPEKAVVSTNKDWNQGIIRNEICGIMILPLCVQHHGYLHGYLKIFLLLFSVSFCSFPYLFHLLLVLSQPPIILPSTGLNETLWGVSAPTIGKEIWNSTFFQPGVRIIGKLMKTRLLQENTSGCMNLEEK